ncbi:hypothetical protein F3Y22_tig00010533pilonHSYRG00130 [Hibiscus syriacus]|uniref:Uncharacterized protein n=1 Tax=Hibiscus syriacus TaxID=106335 RepID=A0A6A3C9U8_HIBSY|nr:hypothetical protein F3Y22_tig00010533pilonHSYRG00130 [Hibiscus syriacus]
MDSRFTQQELPACKPVLTPGLVMELVDRYDDSRAPPNYSYDKLKFIQSAAINKSCGRISPVSLKLSLTVRLFPVASLHGVCLMTHGLSLDSKTIKVNKHDIAWKSGRDHKFGKDVYPKNFQSGGLIGGANLNSSLPSSNQEDLMVWMRTAALPTFRKL